jgi:hypothetical protein
MIDITQIDHGTMPHHERRRCEYIKKAGFFMEKIPSTQCKHTAIYTIEGEHLCERHAGRWLIAYHLHEAKESAK